MLIQVHFDRPLEKFQSVPCIAQRSLDPLFQRNMALGSYYQPVPENIIQTVFSSSLATMLLLHAHRHVGRLFSA